MKKLFLIIFIFFIFFIFFILSSKSWASLSVVQHVEKDCTTNVYTCVITVSATGANNLLLVLNPALFSTPRISDGISNFIQYTSAGGIGNIYYLPLSHSGITSITVTRNIPGQVQAEFWEVSGFNYPVVDEWNTITGGVQSGGSATMTSLTTTTAIEFIASADRSNGTVSGTTGAFTFDDGNGATGNGFAHLITSSKGSNTAIFTDSGSTFQGGTVAFKESTGILLNKSKLNQAKLN